MNSIEIAKIENGYIVTDNTLIGGQPDYYYPTIDIAIEEAKKILKERFNEVQSE